MSEKRRTVFISCGQYTDEERVLGELARKLVDQLTPFEGYFAQNQVSLKTLSENVLTRLYDSVGLIAIMHHRGLVAHNKGLEEISGDKLIRGSVWIEQETAIAAFMEQILHRPLHVALFIQRGIVIEGMRKQLHLNPVEFDTDEEVLRELHRILPTWKDSRYTSDEELRRQANAVVLSVKVIRGSNFAVTIEIRNFSRTPVTIKRIILLSGPRGDTKLCDPIDPSSTDNWTLQPEGPLHLQLRTSDDVGRRMIYVNGREQTSLPTDAVLGPQNRFNPIINIGLYCEILGLEKLVTESCSVQINLTTAEINGL